MLTRFMLALAALGSAMFATVPARAAELYQNYVITTTVDIGYIQLNHVDATGGGGSNSYQIAAPGGVLTSGFPFDTSNPPLFTYFLGVWQDTVNSVDHLVLALDTSYASALLTANDDFVVTFAGFTESELIDALILLGTPDLPTDDPGYAAQMAAKDDAFALLGDFSTLVQGQGGYFAANGGTFSLLAYSTPQQVGGGFTAQISAVPEPGTWAMLLLGFGLVGMALRRRRAPALASS